jgi:hypothetical protein
MEGSLECCLDYTIESDGNVDTIGSNTKINSENKKYRRPAEKPERYVYLDI